MKLLAATSGEGQRSAWGEHLHLMKEWRFVEERLAREMRLANEIRQKQEEDAENTRHLLRAELLWNYQGRIDREVEPYKGVLETVSRLIEQWETEPVNDSDSSILNTLASTRDSLESLESGANAVLNQFILCGQKYLTAWKAQEAEVVRSTLNKYCSGDGFPELVLTYLILASGLFVSFTFVYGVSEGSIFVGLLTGIFMAILGGVPLALVLSRLVTEPLLQSYRSVRDERVIALMAKNSAACCQKAVAAGVQLLSLYREIYQAQKQQIGNEQETDVAAIESQYQQRMAVIADEHMRTLANIRARYAT